MKTTRETRPPIVNCSFKPEPFVWWPLEPIAPSSRRLLEHCLRQYGPTKVTADEIRIEGVRSLEHRMRIVRHLQALTTSLGIQSRLPPRSTAPAVPVAR